MSFWGPGGRWYRARHRVGRLSAPARLFVAVVAVTAGFGSYFAVSAFGNNPLTIAVDGTASSATDAVSADQTYAAFEAAVKATVANHTLTLPFSFQGSHALTVSNATVGYDDSHRSVAFTGTVSLAAFNGGDSAGGSPTNFDFLITATWPDATSTTPKLALVVKTASISLTQLNTLWGGGYGGVTFSDALLGLSSADQTLDPATLPSNAAGLLGSDTMDLKGGVSFRGTFDPTGQVATAFGYAGWGGPIDVEGTLAASPEMLFGDASSTDLASLDLKATLSKSSTAPAWLTDRTTTFEFSLDSSGKAELQAHDDVTVAVDGKTDEFKGDVSIASTGDVSASLANLGTLALPFGLDNVGADIANTRLGLSYDGTTKTFAGTLGFDVTLPSHSEPFTVDAALKVSNDGSASADLSIDGSLSVQDLATFAAGVLNTQAVTIPAADAFTLDKLSFAVEHHSEENVFSVGGQATIHSLQANAVFTLRSKPGEAAEPLLGLALSDPSCGSSVICLSDLFPNGTLGDLGASLKLPAVDLVATPSDFTTIAKSDLTTPELSFFSTVYDTVPDTIDLGGGLTLHAKMPVDALPDSVRKIFGWTTGDIELAGNLGGSATASGLDGGSADLTGLSLKATLPASSGGSLLPSWLSLTAPTELGFSYAKGAVSASLSTAAHVALGAGFDTTIDTSFATTADGSKVDLKATLDDWKQPFGIQWLDVPKGDLEIAADFGTETKVTADLTGSIKVADQPFTLDASLDVGDATKATVSASYDGSTTLASIVGDFASLSGVGTALSSNPALSAVSVGPASITVQAGTEGAAVIFSATAGFDTPAGKHVGATVLAAAKSTGFTLGVKVDAADVKNLSDLIDHAPAVPVAIHSGALVLASSTETLQASSLSDAEFDFYKTLYGCAESDTRATCTAFKTLDVTKGLKLIADVDLPDSLTTAAGALGIQTGGHLLLEGQIPIFGGSVFSLTASLGDMHFFRQPDWFDHGAVSLSISTGGVSFKGDLGVRIRRQGDYNATNCPDGGFVDYTVAGDPISPQACYDKLDFVVSATVDYSDPASPGIEIAGALQTDNGWHHAFGQSWLTIYHAALELGVAVTPTGPEVTLGFQGDVQVGTKDLAAAIKVGLATLEVPPFVRPDLIGVSLASNSGVALSDLVALQQDVAGGATPLDTSALPDVSVRNLFLEYSSENDANLCLTQGVHFNGDLYVGTNLPAPDPVATNGNGCRSFDADPNSPSQSCLDHKANGCAATVGASIDTSGIAAKGELAGYTLGPIQMQDSALHLDLSATQQSLYMAGGVKIASPSYTFADGNGTLSFSHSGFGFSADAAVFNGAFHGYIESSTPFDFQNPSFELKVWLRADANTAIQNAISGGIQTVKPVLLGISQVVQLFGQDGSLTVLKNLPQTLQAAGVSEPPAIKTLVDGIANAAKQIDAYGHSGGTSLNLDLLLKGFKLPDFAGVEGTYVPSKPTCVTTVVNGTCYLTAPWHTAFGDCCGVPGTWVYPSCVGTEVINGTCWAIPPITGPTIGGMCKALGIDPNSVDCSWGGLLLKYVLGPLVQKFNAATGLDLPSSQSQLTSDVNSLVSSLSTPNVNVFSLDCAEFAVAAGAAAQGAANVSLATDMHVFGQELKFGFGWNFGNFNGNAGEVVKEVLQDILNPNPTTCSPIPPGHEQPQVAAETLNTSVSTTSLNEGGSVTWDGTFATSESNYPSVTIGWGDGTTDTIPAGSVQSISKSHVYPQNGPHGFTTGQYTVSATVNDAGAMTNTANEVVANVAPSITSLTATSPSSTENDVVTLDGAFTDPGLQDHHTVTIDWGDGSQPQAVALTLGDRSFKEQHRYLDNPASGSTYTITATVADNDTGTDTKTTDVTIKNAPPSAFTLVPTAASVDEGAYVGYTLTFADPGTLDTHDVVVDWGDSTPTTQVALDAGVLTTTLQHQFVDNGTYAVSATVTDKDGAGVTQTLPITVANVPPQVTVASDVSSVDENGTVNFGFRVADPGVLDSQDVVIDWGDGSTPATVHLAAGKQDFQLSHQYLDDNPTGTPVDINNVQVTATDKDGGVGKGTLPITVKNVPPTVAMTYSSTHIKEGQSVTVDGTITDPGTLDSQTVSVDWGDGTKPTVIKRTPDQRTFEATHTYVDDNPTGTPWDNYTLATTVTDDDTGVGTASQTIRVDNVPPKLANLIWTKNVNEGSAVTVSGDIVDPGLADTETVSIDWKDGTTTVIHRTPAERSFTTSHVYVDDNPTGTPQDPYTPVATVTDDDTGTTSNPMPLTVHNVAPTVTFTTDKQTLNEGQTLTINGQITDPGLADTQTVVVDWGDGTPPQTFPTLPADQRAFTYTHTYLDDNPTGTPSDINHVKVTVTDDDTGVGTATHDVTVNNVPPTVAISLDETTITENNSVTLTGTITDPGVQDTQTVLIDWGPGRTKADEFQTIQLPADQRTFAASKAYGDNGTFPIHVTVTDDDTGVGTADTTLVVQNVAPTAAIDSAGSLSIQGSRTFIARAGVTYALSGHTTDPGSDDLTATWDWQDGFTTQTPYLVAPPNLDPQPSPQVDPRDVTDKQSHVWQSPCLYEGVSFTSTDDDGGTTSDAANVIVTGTESTPHDPGWWANQFSGNGRGHNFGAATLSCYLQVVDYASAYFGDAQALSTSADAFALLRPATPASSSPAFQRAQLEAEILADWLDFADGSLPYTDSAASALASAEQQLGNPAATKADYINLTKAVKALQK